MGGCYNYGLVREEQPLPSEAYFVEKDQILGAYQKACKGGESRGCDAIKKFLLKTCIKRQEQQDEDCYKNGPTGGSGGVSITSIVRVHNQSCDARLKQAELGLGCVEVGDLEAKQGKYAEAEKIYKESCTSETNSDGCKGLVCIGYQKMKQGDKKLAKEYFKRGCEIAHSVPGWMAICEEGSPKKGRQRLPAEIRNGEIKKGEEECDRGWDQAWGPQRAVEATK